MPDKEDPIDGVIQHLEATGQPEYAQAVRKLKEAQQDPLFAQPVPETFALVLNRAMRNQMVFRQTPDGKSYVVRRGPRQEVFAYVERDAGTGKWVAVRKK